MKEKGKSSNGKKVMQQSGTDGKLPALPSSLKAIGINSPYTLYSASLNGQLDNYVQQANLKPAQLKRLVNQIVKSIPAEVKKMLDEGVARPTVTGGIDWTDPWQKQHYESLGMKEPKPLITDEFAKVPFRPLAYLIPQGPVKAVDLRPFLGDARNQENRGTCGVFAGTAVAEAFEYFRDRRSGPIDLSEEFVWWYKGRGQRYDACYFSGEGAISNIRDVGVCEEFVLPYDGRQINDNHGHVPICDAAIDRAQFYRIGDPVSLPQGDIDAAKRVLRSGRCVSIGSDLQGWNEDTGEIAMPPDGTQRGGSHCTTIVGYIDRDDLPEGLGGGYFIVRNCRGRAGSPINVLGPEYGGHLLMPYRWYHLYAGSPHTAMDKNEEDDRNQWLVEYYGNRELRGAPLETRSVCVPAPFPIGDINVDIDMPQKVDEVDFDWGSGSPMQFAFSPSLVLDVLPKDEFSVRFSKVMRFREGWFRFHLRADDGVRLYVDDRLVINEWKDQPDTAFSAEYHLTGGDHIIRIEYYERSGNADVHFEVEPINWHYELFPSYRFDGTPETFDDTLTELEWRHVPPVTAGRGLENGQFGLRGIATLNFKGGNYRFHNFSTGDLRVYLDGRRVAMLPNDGDSQQVAVSPGQHEVRIEFRCTSTVPEMGSHTYYKALCKFGWSDLAWNAKFYKNDRFNYYCDGDHWSELHANPDENYLLAHTSGLTGWIRYQHDYPEAGNMDNNLSFRSWDDFKTGLQDWPTDFQLKFWGVWINRKIVVNTGGFYNLKLDAKTCFRLVLDGKEIVQNQERRLESSPYNADVFLERGVHDLSIEYNSTEGSDHLHFGIQPANWRVKYFGNTLLQGNGLAEQAIPLTEVIKRAQVALGRNTNYSALISRTRFLPLGKYAFAIKADDGVRLKVNNRLLIDAWYDQGPTPYAATFEHQGGDMKIEIEYYNAGSDALLEFSFYPTHFYAEYYNTCTLNRMPEGIRPYITPIAYRYDGDVNFDWGAGSVLPRVNATNFSARWRGKVHLPVGRWNIEATSVDGIRVYIDGRLLIDHWHTQPLTTHARMIDLVGREHDIMVEYFHQTGNAACQVRYFRII